MVQVQLALCEMEEYRLHVSAAYRRNNDPEAHEMNDSEYVVYLFPEDRQRKHEDNIHAG